MDNLEIYNQILAIGTASGREEKTSLLADLLNDDFGRYIVETTYDPFITFGIKPALPKKFGLAEELTKDTLAELVGQLSTRQVTGNAAKKLVTSTFDRLAEHDANILYWVLSKDLKAGVNAATINQVAPGLIPVFSVMRAKAFEERFIKNWPVFVEPKYDGFRVTFLCRHGHGGFFTRSGKRMPQLDHLVEPVIDVAEKIIEKRTASDELMETIHYGDLTVSNRKALCFMLDGEGIVGSFRETSGALRRKNEEADAEFYVYDIMSYEDFDAIGSVGRPYSDRRKLVEEFVSYADDQSIKKSERYFANTVSEVMAFYEGFLNRGLEGAMVKIPDGLYDKKKSTGWLKIKPEETEDLPIVGFFNGEAGTKYEKMTGGLIFRRANGVHVRVGGGYSDSERAELWEDWCHDARILGIDPNVGFKHGYELDPAMTTSGDFDLLGRLGEIEYHEETPDGSLRHPRFVRFRDDKAGELESKEAA